MKKKIFSIFVLLTLAALIMGLTACAGMDVSQIGGVTSKGTVPTYLGMSILSSHSSGNETVAANAPGGVPGKPVKPEEPEKPQGPVSPDEPEKPQGPVKPGEPANPDETGNSSNVTYYEEEEYELTDEEWEELYEMYILYAWYNCNPHSWYPGWNKPWKENDGEPDEEYEEETPANETQIDDVVSIEIGGGDVGIYYVLPGEKFIIQVYIENPSQYEIQSLTLNGEKFANYMFKDGSTMSLILLEMTAPATPGYVSYTIDAIKYIDNTEIKDVLLSGEKTIEAGVSYTTEPSCEIVNASASTTSAQFALTIEDEENVLTESQVIFCMTENEEIVFQKILSVGDNEFTVRGLKMGTAYQYGVVSAYDFIDGNGEQERWLVKGEITTSKAFGFADVMVYDSQVSFKITKEGNEGTIQAIDLLDDEEIVATLMIFSRSYFTDLLSDHDYKIRITYKYDYKGKRTEDYATISFRTGAKTIPTVELTDVTATQTSVEFSIDITDEDEICSIESIRLYQGEELVQTAEDNTVRSFGDLLSDTEYTIKVGYAYNLNDGTGVVETSIEQIIRTNSLEGEITVDNVIYKVEREDGKYFASVIGISSALTRLEIRGYVYNDVPVTKIAANALKNITSIKEVMIPETVVYIGDSAFYNAEGIETVRYGGDLAGWCMITFGANGANPLDQAHNLTIGDEVVTQGIVSFPSTLSEIKYGTFSGCSGMTAIIIPTSVTKISRYAFSMCYGLQKVYYGGTASQWEAIDIDNSNSYLLNSEKYYYAEEHPTVIGNYWHYENNVVVEGPAGDHRYSTQATCVDRTCVICGYVCEATTEHNLNTNCECVMCGMVMHGMNGGSYCCHGDYIYFGMYPQTEVKDRAIVDELNNMAGTLPTSDNSYNWTNYGYYYGTDKDFSWQEGNFMWYIDIDYCGNKYRGIYMKQYRPACIVAKCSAEDSYQDDNGYYINTVYWFKYDWIRWKIVYEEDGIVTLVSDLILDSDDFYRGWYNYYAKSHIRTKLNGEFYEMAFDQMQQSLIVSTYIVNENTTNNPNTNDKIFMLSTSEARDSRFGFTSNQDREKIGTDYAKAQGLYVATNGYSIWRTRTPVADRNHTEYVTENGTTGNHQTVYFAQYGILPALRMIRHQYGAWTVIQAATCTQEGEEQRICSDCGKIDTQSIPMAEHNCTNWYIVTEPTCRTSGEEQSVCNECGITVNRLISRLEHSFENGICIYCGGENDDEIPAEAVEFNGHKYYLFTNVKTWNEAKAYCESVGGHLATITSPEEQEFIVKNYSGEFLLGASDGEIEGVWKWITGEKWEYTDWGAGEPNEYLTGEDQLTMKNSHWNDVDAEGNSYRFLCEWDCYVHNYEEWTIVLNASCTKSGEKQKTCSICGHTVTEVIPALGHEFEDGECVVCGYSQPAYLRVNAQGEEDENGSYMMFGTYPQTNVTSSLGATLSSLYINNLPTEEESNGWSEYQYYDTENMFYTDIMHTDGNKYRAVYFIEYRENPDPNMGQEKNNYYINTIYWFRFDPIKWKILLISDDTAVLHAVQNLDMEIFTSNTNNYIDSNIRFFITHSFYQTAFNQIESSIINEVEIIESNQTYSDKVWLLSIPEIREYYNGGTMKLDTEYSKCMALYDHNGYCGWWTRTPNNENYTWHIGYYGDEYSLNKLGGAGVAPAIKISLHRFGEWAETKEPTCTETGSKRRVCVDCDYIDIQEIPALGHDYVNGVCERCGATADIPDNALTYGGHSYYIFTTVVTWEEAEEYCESRGGHLLTITSAEEQEFLDSYISAGEYWLGASDLVTEGDWQWVTGEPWSYTHWYSNEPNNSTEFDVNGENYLASKSGRWNDLTPLLLRDVSGFVCEWDFTNSPGSSNVELAFEYNSATDTYTVAGIGTCTDTEITIPSTYNGKKVTAIKDSAFSGCSDITAIIIPTSVTTINRYAFSMCEGLQKVYYGGTAGQWGAIDIDNSNSYLVNSEKYYYAEEHPTVIGNYWHYENNVVVEGPAEGHNYLIEATCTDRTCTICGYVCEATTEHELGDWEITTEPTCTQDGERQKTCSVCGYTETEVIPALGHEFEDGECVVCGYVQPAYRRVNAQGEEDENGSYILFGSYPQSRVTNSATIASLENMAGSLPTSENNYLWTDYGYYVDNAVESYMWYIDLQYGSEQYRGVYFTSYRPIAVSDSATTTWSYQDENGYVPSTVYWFKYEPIKWRIVTTENEHTAFLICETAIDSQMFNNEVYSGTQSQTNYEGNTASVYNNNYEYSYIREWLNVSFYQTAFNADEKSLIRLTEVDNSARTTNSSSNVFACNDTTDTVFLISYSEANNNAYGFSSNNSRLKKATDYAKAQGIYVNSNGYSGWWTRSPNYESGSWDYNFGLKVKSTGDFGSEVGHADVYCDVDRTFGGIVPALRINLHSLSNWNVTKESTCTENGMRQRICIECGYSETEIIPALGHEYDNGVCARCGIGTLQTVIIDDIVYSLQPNGVSYYVTDLIDPTGRTNITIRETVNGLPVKGLNMTKSYDLTSLETIVVPNTVTELFVFVGNFTNYPGLQYNYYDHGWYVGNEDNPYLVLVYMPIEITSCRIHADVKLFADKAFYHYPNGEGEDVLEEIVFEGTTEQWNAIQKGAGFFGGEWDERLAPDYVVYCEADPWNQYTRINYSGVETEDGSYMYFGSYPQTKVTDTALISTLNTAAGELPTSEDNKDWTDYSYYGFEGYMWYIDLEYGGEKYRGVYFTGYRPMTAGMGNDETASRIDNAGYVSYTVYWFLFEPIKWRILYEKNGEALILSELIIDSQDFAGAVTEDVRIIDGESVYKNNYEYSTIRTWLNSAFYDTAFTSLQQSIIELTIVDNSEGDNYYACDDTEDYIFLLSENDVTNSTYGFNTSYTAASGERVKISTDYAKVQGAYKETNNGAGFWWLRSPLYAYADRVQCVYSNGSANSATSVTETGWGVSPALYVRLQ